MVIETIKVQTKYGLIEGIPNTKWSDLKPYWPDIIASIIEVVLENDFEISDVRKTNPNGFIASNFYWRAHRKNPDKYPLIGAKKFISAIKNKKRFIKAINEFNKKKRTNWLLEENISTLRRFLRSQCLPLLKLLNKLKTKKLLS